MGQRFSLHGRADGVPVTDRAAGGAYAFSAYLLWGFLPLFFVALIPTGPWEIVAWRIVFSLVFCGLLLTVTRAWTRFGRLVRRPRILAWTALAAVLIYINWQVFILATTSGHVVETSLGYFINPLVTVLLGVLVLHERLRWLQWTALGIAAGAVIVIVVGYGEFPWISIALASSFATYGLVKKRIGPAVDAVSGLTLETVWLIIPASVILTIVAGTSGLTMGTEGPWHAILLVLTGVVTATPLLLFAAGARRLTLTALGLLQFVAPLLQFAIGVWILGEPMPTERWIGFGLVWIALTILSIDSIVASRRHRPGVPDVAPIT